MEEDFRSSLSPATFYNSDSEAIIAVNGAYAMFYPREWFGHRDRVAWWNMAADEHSSTRNIYREPHNIAWGEGVYDGFSIAKATSEHANILQHNLRDSDVRECIIHGASPFRCLLYTSPSPRD